MKILYYCWNEITELDIMDVFGRKGYEVDVDKTPISNKLRDLEFEDTFKAKIKSNNYDCVFTFNFYPVISKVADQCGVRYVSWNYDSPCMTLYSKEIYNSCNYIFCFDRCDVARLQNKGANNVYHMPLAANMVKLNKMLYKNIEDSEYKYDVSFVGRTYNDQDNFYDQIKSMPDYYKGFFDGIMNAQMDIYGCDLASEIITDEFNDVIKSFVRFNLDKELMLNDKDVFLQLLQKKLTSMERPYILKMLSEEGISVTHFAPRREQGLDKVHYREYIDYDKEMPYVFRNSKINLNITLRSILSGIPLRCIDIMGAGGFLLSNYQPELAEYFEDGVEMVMYSSRTDLLDKVHYYLNHDDERIEIAKRGKKKIEEEFSYDIVLEKMFDIVND